MSYCCSSPVFPPQSNEHLKWNAPILRWAVLQPSPSLPVAADVQFINTSLRRKLSPLAKIALSVAYDCAGDLDDVRLIYASQHGDISRTTELLIDLAENEMPSPTAFSMSVLNAAVGAYSIAMQDKSPSTAVSATASSFGYGLLEACMQLASNPDSPVLFVYADEAPPALYADQDNSYTPHAIGLLLGIEASTTIACAMHYSNRQNSQNTQSLAFLDCLNKGESTAWHGEGRTWDWSRLAR